MYYKMKKIPESIEFIVKRNTNTDGLIEEIFPKNTALERREIMNKNEKKMIEQIRKDFVARCLKGSDGCDLRDCQYCHAESLYNAGYRKVGKDETVITKDEYKKLRSAKYDALTYENEVFKIALEKIEQAKQETAREILQELKEKCKELENRFSHLCKSKKECLMETCRYEGVLAVKRELYELAKEKGIELE